MQMRHGENTKPQTCPTTPDEDQAKWKCHVKRLKKRGIPQGTKRKRKDNKQI